MVDLTQIQTSEFLFDIPVEIGIIKEGEIKSTNFKFILNTKNKKIYIPSNSAPQKITIDPNLKLLATTNIYQVK